MASATCATIVEESGLGEFEVGKALYGLVSASFVQRVGRTRAAEPAVSDARVDEHRNLGIAFYKTGMFDEAMREFRRVAELRPAECRGSVLHRSRAHAPRQLARGGRRLPGGERATVTGSPAGAPQSGVRVGAPRAIRRGGDGAGAGGGARGR